MTKWRCCWTKCLMFGTCTFLQTTEKDTKLTKQKKQVTYVWRPGKEKVQLPSAPQWEPARGQGHWSERREIGESPPSKTEREHAVRALYIVTRMCKQHIGSWIKSTLRQSSWSVEKRSFSWEGPALLTARSASSLRRHITQNWTQGPHSDSEVTQAEMACTTTWNRLFST